VVIGRWAYGLIRETAGVLLDHMPRTASRPPLAEQARALLEADGQVNVRHIAVWRVGPHRLAATICLEDAHPRPPEHYKAQLAGIEELVRLTVEIHALPCPAEDRT